MTVLESELNSLIQFMNDLNDDEYNKIFTFDNQEINLNFIELVNIYYNILPVKIPNRRSRRYRKKGFARDSESHINKRCFARESIDPKQIDHFKDVVNEFIKYLQKENLKVRCTEKPSFNVSILKYT